MSVHLSCTDTNTVSKQERSEIPHDPRHIGVPSGASKTIFEPMVCFDEDINPDTGMATPTEPAQAPPGPITRARARELNFVMILKNEGPEVS